MKDSGTRSYNGSIIWECKCDCGNLTKVESRSLNSNHTKSCGCLQREHASKLGSTRNTSEAQKYNKKYNYKEDTYIRMLSNVKVRNNSVSGITGVTYDKKRRKWAAKIGFQGKLINLGRYDTIEEAKKVRYEAEEKYFKPIIEKYS